ncbi:RidA family protein [Streptomyces europaeiscabiei]|uniref:RidA family protein n=1 Tax=Streptomyces europaeiscabiei TaxID=146819 RepID=A0ABU4NSQ9_9ACTN|nr:RidA family protein [Streptomyces europaeiscabiei]MDX2524659.1 RidA family protein [Streptomyces europaeiscabiei]MDX2762492.1 RidA family protein [Streptomyces europaeiscabiei]MDX2769163.1 RidA family protein [Streptomyces europaeiscabiei]MDX3548519.1 RidA family protein [Streptomyces europaeiscabiei]MDX3558162.1 RidA family protein [Streptomyces europaeiscabiei]
MTAIDSYSHGVSGEREFGFAQAIRVDHTIYVSGQLSHDAEGNFLYPGDFDAQSEQVFANFEKVLAHYGATRNQVVSETQYIVDLPKYNNAMAAANLAYFGDHHPTSSTIGVAHLFFPGQLIETNFVIDTRLPA